MPRVIGVDIPGKKRIEYALRYIYGVDPARAKEVVERLGLDPACKADDLNGEQIAALSKLLQEEYVVEGDLRREVNGNIRRLIAVNCYRGIRLDEDGESNPSPEQTAEAMRNRSVCIMTGDSMIVSEPDDMYMTLFNADAELLSLFRTLAAGEGLYVWKPEKNV